MKYKLSSSISIDEFDGYTILTSKNELGEIDFTNAIVLEEVSALIINCINDNLDVDGIVEKISSEYDVDKQKAKEDLLHFIEELKEKGIIIND